MNRLFLLLLIIGLFFWWLKPPVHNITLDDRARPPVLNKLPANGMLEITIPDAGMDYYDVSGSTVAEIRDNLNRSHRSGGFDGYTGWHVSWNWPGYGSSDCNLAAASLDTRISVRLPRWQPPQNADPALVLKWNSYLGNLAFHEQGHVQLARQGFAKMQQILQASTCDEADAKLNAVLGEMRQADLRYDAETRHGSTQGAKFP